MRPLNAFTSRLGWRDAVRAAFTPARRDCVSMQLGFLTDDPQPYWCARGTATDLRTHDILAVRRPDTGAHTLMVVQNVHSRQGWTALELREFLRRRQVRDVRA